jgi:nicotinamidase-related amidase
MGSGDSGRRPLAKALAPDHHLMPAALLLVDVQYSFLPPDGELQVPNGLDILAPTYRLLDNATFAAVIASQARPPLLNTNF